MGEQRLEPGRMQMRMNTTGCTRRGLPYDGDKLGVIMADSKSAAAAGPYGPLGVGNLGEPLRFEKVQPLTGVVAKSVRRGEQAMVLTRHAVSSDDPSFHSLVEGLNGVVQHMAQTAGIGVSLQRANTVLWVIRPDRSAELWIRRPPDFE